MKSPEGRDPERPSLAVSLGRLEAGERAALAEVFDHYRPRLNHMVRLRLDAPVHRRVDASDVVQESYLDAANRLPEYLRERKVPLYVWLRGLVHGRLLKVLRHHRGAQCRAVGREVASPSSTGIAEALAATQTSPSQAAEREERRGRVRLALERLGDDDRDILLMRHFEGLGNRDVASALGIQASTAAMRYGRALERLGRMLDRDTMASTREESVR